MLCWRSRKGHASGPQPPEKTGRSGHLVWPRGDAAGRLFERREATLADTHRLCDAALAPANRTQLSGAYAALGDGAAVGSAVLVGAVSISSARMAALGQGNHAWFVVP